MSLGKWLEAFGNMLDDDSEKGGEKGTTWQKAHNQVVDVINKLGKAHNKLREEHDLLSADHEQLKGEVLKLKGKHNEMVRELGRTKKDLKSDIERLERRIASILDPVGDTTSFLEGDPVDGS